MAITKIREQNENSLKNLKPFQPGNPGRPKGSRNRLGENFIEALHDDFQQHGIAAIEDMRKDDPGAYVRVIAGILPKEMKVTTASDLTDEQLDARIKQLAAALNLEIRVSGDAGGEGAPQTAH
jgi:hypothetical protein